MPAIEKITVPKICCLLTNSKKDSIQTRRFLHKIFLLQSKSIVIDLDFTHCNFFSIDCCVILGAIFDSSKKLQDIGGGSAVLTGNFPPNDRIVFLLKKLDLYQFTNIKVNFNETGLFEKKYSILPLDTGFCPTNYTPEEIDKKIRLLFPNISDIKIKKVFEAISEAILNITDHAYPIKNNCIPQLLIDNKSRWFIGIHDLEKNIVSLAIYDFGIGIPEKFKTYDAKFKTVKDSDIIANAMIKGVTTSGLKERGLGSENLKDILQSFDNSFLRIISQKGSYQIDNFGEIQLLNFDCSIKGTLLCWQICLN